VDDYTSDVVVLLMGVCDGDVMLTGIHPPAI